MSTNKTPVKKNVGWMLLTGASLAAMGALSPAMAQEDTAVEDEIVVTATGRSAAIQDVPLAVTAVGRDQLENTGVQDLRDVVQVAPSLVMGTGQSNSSGTIAYIRGIGTGSDNPGFEGAVGIFIDGVYRSRAGAALADLPELERVEILRGPQGTLFGRNTSAGAISVITAGPAFDPGMYLEALYGLDDLNEAGMRAGVNVPFNDTFAIRLDGTLRSRDGYITDLISDKDINTTNRWSARGQAQWDISPDASLRVIVDGAGSDEVCCGVTPLQYGSTQGVISLLTGGAGTPAINLDRRGMTVTPGRDYNETTDDFGVSGQLDWDIGGVKLTSITAFRDWSATRNQDVDFNLIDVAYRDGLEVGFETFTQEFRFQGEAGPVNWLVGLFYGDEKLDTTDRIRLGAQTVAFTNTTTIGGTAPVFGPPGCELVNTNPLIPSLFQCFNAAFIQTNPLIPAPAKAAYTAAINGTNAGHLLPSAAGQGQQADRWQVDTQSISLFTHNEINLSDNMVLTLGARYNQDTKDLQANIFATNTTCDSLRQMETATSGIIAATGVVSAMQAASPSLATLLNLSCNPAVNPIANGAWTGSREENEFSGTASLAYHLNEDLMVYGGYSRGYKSGGFNLDRSGFAITPALTSTAALNVRQLEFTPEFTDAYELGLKSTLFGGTTTANVAAFFQQIHDYQLNAFNGFNFITRNIPEVVSQGAELEISSRPMDGLTLNAGVVYTDAFFDSTVVFNPFDPGPNTVSAGDPLAQSAKWVVTGGVSYEVPITSEYRALFYLDGRWNDGYRVQTLARNPASDNQAYTVFNGRISFGPQSEHWSIDLWGQNLTDELWNIGAFQPPLQNTTVIYPSAPRTYGVTIRARY